MLMLDENPHTSSRQTASALNMPFLDSPRIDRKSDAPYKQIHSSILRVLTEYQMHPYKLVSTNELAEDDFDKRILFCEHI
ncbi:hypothetical protein NQ318_021245 [Aromia moschata]|uniref:Uncharacterized protein n=1 Tax=Aromia moschata TaxID=1265417 RepID=A0AAV8X8X0_9CUCU|nr:hypothetical protein NQ318_021245 [Aromia moschata]